MTKAATKPRKKAAPKTKVSAKPKASKEIPTVCEGTLSHKGKRLPSTAWQPGVSGNPGGMPKGLGEVKKLARQYTAVAIQTLHDIMIDKEQTGSARVGAANSLLDRGYGRPIQQVEVGGPGDFANMAEDEIDRFISRASMQLSALTVMNTDLMCAH